MPKTTFKVDKDKLRIVLTRVYDASRERLWKAYTDPEEIPKWWGPAYLTTKVDKMDVKVGGSWRFVQTEPNGKEHAFRGVYKELDEPNKLTNTFEYEPMAGHIILESVTFNESDGKTTIIAVSKYDNIGDLEGMVAMDMESGAVESQERLAKLVE